MTFYVIHPVRKRYLGGSHVFAIHMHNTLWCSDYNVSCSTCGYCKKVNILKYYAVMGKEKPIKMSKKLVFTENLKAEYLFLKEDQQVRKVFCSM
jgi:hypothetical protein